VEYQRRTKKGVGRLKKTVPQGTVKTQRVEAAMAVSAIDGEVRFLFIVYFLLIRKIVVVQRNQFFVKMGD